MDTAMDKTRLLEAIAGEHAALDSLLGTLDGPLLIRPGVYGDLAITDVLAHLAAWENMEAGWLDATLRGEPVVRFAPGFELTGDNYEATLEALNAQIFAENRDRPPAAILADLRTAQIRVLAAVQALSADDLTDPHRFPWWDGEPIWTSIAGNTHEHYAEHRALIGAWLARLREANSGSGS